MREARECLEPADRPVESLFAKRLIIQRPLARKAHQQLRAAVIIGQLRRRLHWPLAHARGHHHVKWSFGRRRNVMNIDMHVVRCDFMEHAVDWSDPAFDVRGNGFDDFGVASDEALRRRGFGVPVDLGFGCETFFVRAHNSTAAYDRRAGGETNSMSASGVRCMTCLSSCRDVFAIQNVTETPAKSASTRHDACPAICSSPTTFAVNVVTPRPGT